jgi:hypothetical protein
MRKDGVWQNHLKNEGFVALGSIGGFSMKRECTNTSHKQKIPYIKFKYNYYTLVSCIRVTKGWSPKYASKD